MINFSKGYNTQNNVDTNKYAKMGRMTPEEIIQRRFENNSNNMNGMNNLNNAPKEEIKVEQQKNTGADLFNKMSAFKRINNNK